MSEAPNYYAIIPAHIRYDEHLNSNEKLLYAEITSLSNKNGYCWATNKHFADLFKTSEKTITRWIKSLESKNYIKCEVGTFRYADGTVKKTRKIYIDNFVPYHMDIYGNNHMDNFGQNHMDKNVPYNNTIVNNTIVNKERTFVRPSVQEVADYVKEANLNVDAQAFIDYYDSNGWKVGKVKMKDWKATCRGWHRREKPKSEIKSTYDIDKITHDTMYNDNYDV